MVMSGNALGRNNKKPRQRISLKDARKPNRVDQKKRKAEFFAAPSLNPGKRSADVEHIESPKRKKIKVADPEPVQSSRCRVDSIGDKIKVSPSLPPSRPKAALKTKTEPRTTALEKLVTMRPEIRQGSSFPRSQTEREDDAYIAYLESKLGYSKGGKAKKQAKEDDGLDGALLFASADISYLIYKCADLLHFHILHCSVYTAGPSNNKGL